MKKILFHIIQYGIFIALSIVLLYFAFRNIDFNILRDRILHADYRYISIALILGFIGIYIRAYRWNILIEPLGKLPQNKNAFYALSIGYMANYAFPRIGEVTRCGVLSRTEKIGADKLLGTVISERIFDIIVLFLLTILIILLKIRFFGDFFIQKVFHPLSHKLFEFFSISYTVFLFGLISLIALVLIVFAYRENIQKITLFKKVGRAGKGIYKGIKTVLKIKRFFEFILHTVLMWSTYWLMTYFFLKSIESTSHLGLLDALFIMIAGSYGMAAPVQAGIGAYHGIIALSLSIYFISWNDGLAFALLSHGSQAIGIILLGLVSMTILFFRKKREKLIHSSNN